MILDRVWSDDEDESYGVENYNYNGAEYYGEEIEPPRSEAMMELEYLKQEERVGPSLGQVLGLIIILKQKDNWFLYLGVTSVIIIIFYCLGMGLKLYKIWRGEYVEEEPVFLKYK